ncbi:hypothetical protein GGS20DRAFT_587760 [Poronia punctata]|nr:hypothetical protein GGS20DRAFT_587760 [Poronia punctata]
MSVRQITAAAILAMASFGNATTKQLPIGIPSLGTDTVAGCYDSLADMEQVASWKYNTQGWCSEKCRKKDKPVGATYSRTCYCGDKLPNLKNLLNDSKCNEPCPGFGDQACGGLDAYTVYNTGLVINVPRADYEDSSSSSTTTAPTPTRTQVPDTVETSAEASATEKPKSGSNSSTIGIAVGVVVGVIVVVAIAVTSFFVMRRRRNTELEEEHRRNAAVNAFISGGKAPSSSNMSIADSRMDPVMNRRMSDGSIADNQDYSRRILRVTNA